MAKEAEICGEKGLHMWQKRERSSIPVLQLWMHTNIQIYTCAQRISNIVYVYRYQVQYTYIANIVYSIQSNIVYVYRAFSLHAHTHAGASMHTRIKKIPFYIYITKYVYHIKKNSHHYIFYKKIIFPPSQTERWRRARAKSSTFMRI